MSFFRQPKPRRFHHEPIYYDEHRDRAREIEKRAKKELGMDEQKKFNPEDLRGVFTSEVRQRRSKSRNTFFGLAQANTGAIVVIILILLLVWFYLSR